MTVDRGTAMALSAAGGVLAALGCAATAAGPSGPQPMPEYPPLAEADAGASRKVASPEAASPKPRAVARPASKNCCKGQNACKGQGNCKTAYNACKGMNDCKGKGGCKSFDCEKRCSPGDPLCAP